MLQLSFKLNLHSNLLSNKVQFLIFTFKYNIILLNKIIIKIVQEVTDETKIIFYFSNLQFCNLLTWWQKYIFSVRIQLNSNSNTICFLPRANPCEIYIEILQSSNKTCYSKEVTSIAFSITYILLNFRIHYIHQIYYLDTHTHICIHIINSTL